MLLRCMYTRVQMYDRKADWENLGEVKKNLTRIPLIGNGDVRSPSEDAKRMSDIAGVDGVGRCSLSEPADDSSNGSLFRNRRI